MVDISIGGSLKKFMAFIRARIPGRLPQILSNFWRKKAKTTESYTDANTAYQKWQLIQTTSSWKQLTPSQKQQIRYPYLNESVAAVGVRLDALIWFAAALLAIGVFGYMVYRPLAFNAEMRASRDERLATAQADTSANISSVGIAEVREIGATAIPTLEPTLEMTGSSSQPSGEYVGVNWPSAK